MMLDFVVWITTVVYFFALIIHLDKSGTNISIQLEKCAAERHYFLTRNTLSFNFYKQRKIKTKFNCI